jgi:NADH-quinone oxidoreductase subunit M
MNFNLNLFSNGEAFYFYASQNILGGLLLTALLTILILYIGAQFWNNTILYQIALGSSVLSFLLSLCLWYSLNDTKEGFQATYTFYLIPTYPFEIRLGVDGISIFFLLLTNIFTYLCVLSLNPNTFKLLEALLYLFLLQ